MEIVGHRLTWLWLVVIALAAFRVVWFVQRDDFPGWGGWRTALLRRWPAGPGRVSELLVCPWCMGVWAAAGAVTWWLLSPATLAPVALVLAIAAVVAILTEWARSL